MTTIRVATEADAEEILAIYAKYTEQIAIAFEYVVPSIEEFRGMIRHTLQRFPYLAAEKDGKIAGYAYVSPFKERAAYDWSVETSIYVDMEQKRSGITSCGHLKAYSGLLPTTLSLRRVTVSGKTGKRSSVTTTISLISWSRRGGRPCRTGGPGPCLEPRRHSIRGHWPVG